MTWNAPHTWTDPDQASTTKMQSLTAAILWLAGGATGDKAQFAATLASTAGIANNTVTTVRWDTVSEDTDSAYNPVTGLWTAAQAGSYLVTATFQWATAGTGSRYLQILHSGGHHAFDSADATLDSLGRTSCSKRLRLAAGDTVRAAVFQLSGGTLAPAGGSVCEMTIDQIGL